MNFLIGCDPEIFVADKDGFNVSAHDMIPGTKESPFGVERGAIQVDGTALEFNIHPADSKESFVLNIETVLDELRKRIESIDPFYHLTFEPTALYDPEYFKELPIEAKLLGCTPDFNAYTGEENHPPHTDEPFRTAGGHIHIGWGEYLDILDPDHFSTCRDVVKQLDALLYPASEIWDRDVDRRKLYGQVGAFRPKSYGVEYRPLSCVWIKDRETQEFVYDTTIKAVDLFFNKGVRIYE